MKIEKINCQECGSEWSISSFYCKFREGDTCSSVNNESDTCNEQNCHPKIKEFGIE